MVEDGCNEWPRSRIYNPTPRYIKTRHFIKKQQTSTRSLGGHIDVESTDRHLALASSSTRSGFELWGHRLEPEVGSSTSTRCLWLFLICSIFFVFWASTRWSPSSTRPLATFLFTWQLFSAACDFVLVRSGSSWVHLGKSQNHLKTPENTN